ncbi:MAG: 4Fe-4S binding protein [Nitrospirae bacterium]|nr:4Fe-4S binding protein [Nitrospirota bacterium]
MQDVIDLEYFHNEVMTAYGEGRGDDELPAETALARSIVPPATGELRDFSYIAPDIPILDPAKCIGCMECVAECPDTAILARVSPENVYNDIIRNLHAPSDAESIKSRSVTTTKYGKVMAKKGKPPGQFVLWVDPTKCKGCGECVEVCGTNYALTMVKKTPPMLEEHRRANLLIRDRFPDTPEDYVNEKTLADMMLVQKGLAYVGGAGSCMGCGEATAIRMMTSATTFVYGERSMCVVAATGCNTVFGSTFPYNPYKVSWINSLFENCATVAIGVRGMYDRLGFKRHRIWALGGDGAMADIGFQALSRMLTTGQDIKCMIVDTQVYSNTGGQASSQTFIGQDAKMSAFGREIGGKTERKKELGTILMMHPDVYVAQTTPAHITHFYRSILAANEYAGPAVVIAYAACQVEHGIGDEAAFRQAKLATDSRAFPLFTYDPRRGSSMKERLSLQGNRSIEGDWVTGKDGKEIKFVDWARSEGRFAKHFGANGEPSETVLKAQEDRLRYWKLLKELAGAA